MSNWIKRFLAAIVFHKGNASAHHTKYTNDEALAAAIAGGLSKVIWRSTTPTVMEDNARFVTLDWTDLDLNLVTSDNAKFAILQLRFRPMTIGTGSNSYLGVRKNGETPTYFPRIDTYIDGLVGAERFYALVIVGMDSSQVIEYKIDVGADWEVDSDIDVLGYIE